MAEDPPPAGGRGVGRGGWGEGSVPLAQPSSVQVEGLICLIRNSSKFIKHSFPPCFLTVRVICFIVKKNSNQEMK